MKAKLKEKELSTNGMEAKDLSIEKRMELYQAALKAFDEEATKTYGMTIDIELVYSKKGIIPRMVLVDALKTKKENESKVNNTTEEKEGSKE